MSTADWLFICLIACPLLGIGIYFIFRANSD